MNLIGINGKVLALVTKSACTNAIRALKLCAKSSAKCLTIKLRKAIRTTMDPYISWLNESKQPLFEGAGTYWRGYKNALGPASLKPQPVELSREQAQERLKESGASFLHN